MQRRASMPNLLNSKRLDCAAARNHNATAGLLQVAEALETCFACCDNTLACNFLHGQRPGLWRW